MKEVVVVEGRYDRNTLLQVVDATVVEVGGFSLFHDDEKTAYLRDLAEKNGIILMTDADSAGFVIRNHLKGCLPPERVKQAYIPDVYGKERRKKKPGKEGKLGVEGMRPEVLVEAARSAIAQEPERKVCQVQLRLVYEKDRWLIQPDQALLDILAGKMENQGA